MGSTLYIFKNTRIDRYVLHCRAEKAIDVLALVSSRDRSVVLLAFIRDRGVDRIVLCRDELLGSRHDVWVLLFDGD